MKTWRDIRVEFRASRLDAMKRLAAEGKSLMEAAVELGIGYSHLNQIALNNSIRFRRQNATKNLAIVVRNKEVLARFAAGSTLQEIGDEFGITRERVRQIVEKSGTKPRAVQKEELYELIAKAVEADNLSLSEAAARFNVENGVVSRACRMHDVAWRKDHLYDTPEIAAMAELVKDGMSMHQAASGDHRRESLLRRYCTANGIKSAHKARWRDMKPRKAMILAMRPKHPWSELASAVGAMEGKPVGATALYNWATSHMRDHPEVFTKPDKLPKLRPPFVPKHRKKESEPILIGQTIRETAKLNRGRATAQQIAAAVGTSRNVIIGHWGRMRQKGEIA